MNSKYGTIVFNSPKDSAGFFSNYFSVLSTIVGCLHHKIIPYVDTSNTWFNPTCNFETYTVEDPTINPWNWWFDQQTPPVNIEYKIPIDRSYVDQDPQRFTEQPNLDLLRKIADNYCKIQLHILEEEELLYEQYLENKNTLGILARGTEMLVHHLEYQKVLPETWPSIIKFCLDKHPDIDNIFLVSDDRRIIENVLEAFPETKYLEHFFRSSNQTKEELSDNIRPWWLFSPDSNPDHRKRVGEETLIQTRLLSKCNYFVGAHSGMTSGVNFFRKTPFKANYIV